MDQRLVDFVETKGKTAEDLTQFIVDKIQRDGLDIQDCRGQAYDNAAVMAGVHTGVQAHIKAINPKACTNHSLNLVGIHAASVAVDSVTFFRNFLACLCVFCIFNPSLGLTDCCNCTRSEAFGRNALEHKI